MNCKYFHQDSEKKYFKRGDLIEKEREEYIQKYLKTNQSSQSSSTGHHENSSSLSRDPDLMNLPRSEVIRKLRERGEPILVSFGASLLHFIIINLYYNSMFSFMENQKEMLVLDFVNWKFLHLK